MYVYNNYNNDLGKYFAKKECINNIIELITV